MPTIRVNGIELAYDWHGEETGPVVLLVMGLGLPSSAWPPEFVDGLTAAGYRVLTFDNRDTGRSQLLDHLKTPNIAIQGIRYACRLPTRAPYRLADMAADASGLLEALGVSRAHLVGASMGGMIAQIMAVESPQRAISLTSLMSTTNARRLPRPRWRVARYMLKRSRSLSPAKLRTYHEGFWPLIESPAYRHTPRELEQFIDRLFERGMSARGAMRQALAIIASGDRSESLAALRVPTLVVHGDADPLLPVEHGYATAQAIRDAEILILEGMGHDIPRALIPRIVAALVAHKRVCDMAASGAARPVREASAPLEHAGDGPVTEAIGDVRNV